MERRPISQRQSGWARATAHCLAGWGITPNAISGVSVVAAALGSAAILLASDAVLPWALVIYALCIQIRLLCNMLDGMVAVEHQMGSPVGELYNEVPDRIADVLFLASFGYLSTIQPLGHVLGWSAAALALGSAYIRALGGQLVGGQDFGGILAKPRRMFLLTVGAGLCALALWSGLPITWIVLTTLGLLTLGSGVTVIQRLRRLAAQLRQQE